MLSSHLSRCLTLAAAIFSGSAAGGAALAGSILIAPVLAGAVFAEPCAAQVMQDPGTMPDGNRVHFPGAAQRRHHPDVPAQEPPSPPADAQSPHSQVKVGSTSAAHAAPAAAPGVSVPPSLLDQPPQPASVSLSSGQLAVKADNSSLTQILHQLASSSGMSIDGLSKDQRVFGTYGPGSPQQVLTALLDGAGYNVMMVGATPDGAPRQLILTARSNAPVASQGNPSESQPQPDEDDNDNADNGTVNFPERVTEPPPSPQEQPPSQGVKTPAQILQELQQLRQQQQQQAPQQ